MGEGVQDFGGFRKEFFRLVFKEIKEKLFDNGLNEDFVEQYYIKCFIEWENFYFFVREIILRFC